MKSPIEDLRAELQRNSGVPHNKKIIHDASVVSKPALDLVLPSEQKKSAYNIPKNKFVTTIFYVSLTFFLCVFLYMIYTYKIADTVISNKKIDVHVVAPIKIISGKDAIFKISLSNQNTAPLINPEIVATAIEINTSKTSPLLEKYEKEIRIPVPEIAAKNILNQDIPILLLGSEGEKFLIQSKLEYSLPDSVARFTKEIFTQEVVITQNPIAIIPKIDSIVVVEGQDFSIPFIIQNNDTENFENIAMRITTPDGVIQNIKELKSFSDGYTYPIGILNKKELLSFNISGILEPQSLDTSSIMIEIVKLKNFGDPEITGVLSKNSIIIIKQKPFVTARLSTENSTVTVIPLRDITTSITIKNNDKEDLQDIEIRLTAIGEIISAISLESDVASSLGAGEIIFNKFTDERLAVLRPNESITVPLKFSSNPVVTGSMLTENPESTLLATITAQNQNLEKKILQNYQVGKVQGQTLAELTFETIPSENGTFMEDGPFPFTVGKSSTVNVKFTLKNTSNTLNDGKVSFKLPYYVNYGINKSIGENVQFNSVDRSVTWNFGDLPAGAGIVEGTQRELVITLIITPIVAQVSQYIPLTSDISLTGSDSLTKKNTVVKRPSLKASFEGATDDQLKVQRK